MASTTTPRNCRRPSLTVDPAGPAAGITVSDLIYVSGTASLHAAGDITETSGGITADTVVLVSDGGKIGTALAPIQMTVNTLVASTINQDISISAAALGGTLTIGDDSGGIDAGTGNVILSSAADITATNTIVANNLQISGNSISLPTPIS